LASIVHQHANVIATPGGCLYLLGIGDIELYSHDTVRGFSDQMLRIRDQPRANVNALGPGFQEGTHKRLAYAPVAARNEGDTLFNLHGRHSGIVAFGRSLVTHLIRRSNSADNRSENESVQWRNARTPQGKQFFFEKKNQKSFYVLKLKNSLF
jgi:hypothetical protein